MRAVYSLVLVIIVVMMGGMLFKGVNKDQAELFSFFINDEQLVQLSSVAAADRVYLEDSFRNSIKLAYENVSVGTPTTDFCCYATNMMNRAIRGRGLDSLLSCSNAGVGQVDCFPTTGVGFDVSGTDVKLCSDATGVVFPMACDYIAYEQAIIQQGFTFAGTIGSPVSCSYSECDFDGDLCLDANEGYGDSNGDGIPDISDPCKQSSCPTGKNYYCDANCRPFSCAGRETSVPDCSGAPTCTDMCELPTSVPPVAAPGGADNDGDGYHLPDTDPDYLDSDKDCYDIDCGNDSNENGIVDDCEPKV